MSSQPLHPSPEQLRLWTEQCVSFVQEHVATLEAQPASDLENAELVARSFREPVPESPTALSTLLKRLQEAISKSLNTAGPGYLAYIPGGGLPAAALADYLAASVNRYVGVTQTAPALVEIEATALRWLASLLGYPETARGIFTSGGSLANFTALATARIALLPEDFLQSCLYLTGETHVSLAKAARLAGFPARCLRTVPTDARLRLEPSALRERIRSDRASGLTPFLILANAGTTNTGAVDPLEEICDIAAEERLWVHADGAYGGLFRLADNALLPGLERCDSITIDPHKALFLPYGVGCLLVRDGTALRRAHQLEAGYLRDTLSEDESINFAEYSPELTRPFRGLQVWLSLQLHGLPAFRTALQEKLDLARQAAQRLQQNPLFEVVDPPQLSIVAFRLRDADDAGNMELLRRVHARGRVFLSSTLLRGRVYLRMCVLSFRTHQERVEEALEALEQEALATQEQYKR